MEAPKNDIESDRAARLRISDATDLLVKIETIGNSLVIPFVVINVPLLTIAFNTDNIFENFRYTAMSAGLIVSAFWFLANQKLQRKVELCQKTIREQALLHETSVSQEVERSIRASVWRALPESANLRTVLYLLGMAAHAYAWGINDCELALC